MNFEEALHFFLAYRTPKFEQILSGLSVEDQTKVHEIFIFLDAIKGFSVEKHGGRVPDGNYLDAMNEASSYVFCRVIADPLCTDIDDQGFLEQMPFFWNEFMSFKELDSISEAVKH